MICGRGLPLHAGLPKEDSRNVEGQGGATVDLSARHGDGTQASRLTGTGTSLFCVVLPS